MPARAGSSGAAKKAAKRFPSEASSVRSSCETAAPEIAGIGGAESRSKHIPPSYNLATSPRSAGQRALGGASDTVSQGSDQAFEVVVVRPPADGGAHEAAAGQVTDDHAGLGEPGNDVGGLVGRDTPRDESGACVRHDHVTPHVGQARPEALGHFGGAPVPRLRDRTNR